METKQCRRCKSIKSVHEFSIENANPTGFNRWCKQCYKEYRAERRARDRELHRNWAHRTGRMLPMQDNKKCPVFLGVHIAERALSKFFDHIERMPYGNKGYDFLCGKGYKIDVKSSCIAKFGGWMFTVSKNKTADYFLCLAFDNRDSLNPLHVWLIPGNVVNNRMLIQIPNNFQALEKYSKYERSTDNVIACCTAMKNEAC